MSSLIRFFILVFSCRIGGVASLFWSSNSAEKSQCVGDKCTLQVFANGEWENGQSVQLSVADCSNEAGLGAVICSRTGYQEDCQLFNSKGILVTGCTDFKTEDPVYVVPSNRLFMWPSFEVGHKVEIKHVEMPLGDNKPIILETLSQRPRVFRLQNFFSDAEAEDLINHALSIEEEDFKLKRSSTGATGYTIDSKRTSEGAFDVNSPTALAIKKRSFDLLGVRPFDESFADGIQILRYNQTTAYIAHMDWIEPTKLNNNHDWESAGTGTNRYATILLYLSGVEDGGETVFTQAKPIGPDARVISKKQAEAETSAYLDSKNLTDLFPQDTWQRNMIVECRSRMAVKPVKAEAVLFYSQFPDGRADRLSVHGGCPVLIGQKWAANLWVWNGPRNGYSRNRAVQAERPSLLAVSASFDAEVDAGAKLYWQDQEWGVLVPGKPIRVNTYEGHKWTVKLDGEDILEWTVGGDDETQSFVLTQSDLEHQ